MTVDHERIRHMTRNEADMAFKKRVETIFEWLPPTDDMRILDCACGRGFYLNMYRYVSGCTLVGLELESDIIRKAQRNVGHLPDLTLVQGNMYTLPFPDDYFDGVILSEILEHIDDDVAGLREVYRVLKPGGVIAITVPHANYPFLWDPINKTLETLFKRPIRRGPLAGIWANHVRLYERDDLRAAVEAAGYTVEVERQFTHHSFPFIHNLVYGLGKPLLESGLMPRRMATAADRTTFDQNRGSLLNPINLGIAILNWFDRKNVLDEPPGRSTVNLALKARKPLAHAPAPDRMSYADYVVTGDEATAALAGMMLDDDDSDGYRAIPPRDDTLVIFEDLTLSQALGYLIWRPVETLKLFWQVLTYDPVEGEETITGRTVAVESQYVLPTPRPAQPAYEPAAMDTDRDEYLDHADLYDEDDRYDDGAAPAHAATWMLPARSRPVEAIRERVAWTWIAVLAIALLLAARGGFVLRRAALDIESHAHGDTDGAGIWLALAGCVYLGYAIFRSRGWWALRFPRAGDWLRARFYANDMPYTWVAGLGTGLLIMLGLGLFGLGGALGAAILFAGAACLWLAIAVGSLPPQAEIALDADDLDAAPPRVPAPARRVPPAVPVARPWWAWIQAHIERLVLIPVAFMLSVLAYTQNVVEDTAGRVVDIEFTTGGFLAWVGSIALWIVILGVDLSRVPAWWAAWQRFDPRGSAQGWGARLRAWRPNWALLILAAITVFGAWFRLHDLASTPPDMTSDHIEKLLDAMRVSDGYRGVFFPNNGGREGFQMYLVAFIADTFNVGLSFKALKLATVLEGVVTLPLLWWMARQIIGDATERDRQLGNWIGLALAGLVAISSWHLMLSRLGLRIVLTPFTTTLVVGFLARVMRHNRLRDYLALGFTLGAGIYFYQANRMLPILVVIGVALALLGQVRRPKDALRLAGDGLGFLAVTVAPLLVYWYIARLLEQSSHVNPRDLGEKLSSYLPLFVMIWFSLLALVARARRTDSVLQYGGGLLAAAVVALAVYVPMYHYSEVRPDDFWNRTRGRLFGEFAFQRADAAGNMVIYEPSLGEQIERFWDERDVFVNNYADALLMYNWEGDGAWINNANSRPAMDGVTGGLVILGLLMWGVRIVKRPSAVNWLPLATIMVMLLPSAMTLAYTIENPSFTRSSGTIPGVFLLAAVPLGTLCWRLAHMPLPMPQQARVLPLGAVAALVILGGVLGNAYAPNESNFYDAYRLHYSYSWKPYSEIAKPLREFARSSNGSYGNAFMIAFPHWLDHRILGTMAGDIRWPNGLVNDPGTNPVTREYVLSTIARNKGTPYQYDPTKPLFFMYHAADSDTAAFLEEHFPGGQTEAYEYTYETELGWQKGSFYIYRVWTPWLTD